ncbi:SRPBCC family protein [Actinomycetes bacterium KLBMP 9759]
MATDSRPSALPATRHVTSASPDAVWAVLADGWSYPCWVVGAARMRSVSADWPAVGAVLNHSVGPWPAMIDDKTVVRRCEPSRLLVLRGRAWPVGEAEIVIELAPADGGGCEIVLREDAVAGPGTLLPSVVRDPLIRLRNVESLKRLALMAERRTA